MKTKNMDRTRAAALHLGISTAIAVVVFLAARGLWYPGLFYDNAGGRDLFLLIVAVDVVIGPLITLIVFRPGKPGLAFDLTCIAVLQLAALGYGLWTISLARPAYVVFVKDRFELARASDIEPADLERARATPWANLPWTGPRYIGVAFPTDPQERFNLALSGIAGKDIHTFPRYYVPYERVASEARAAARPLGELRALNPGKETRVDALPATYGRAAAELAFLPLKTDRADLTVILAARDGAVLGLESLRPWDYR
jgi:hypothetical protein